MKLRTSLYTIFIKLSDDDKNFLLIHGYTGAIDKVTYKVADFLRKGGKCDSNLSQQRLNLEVIDTLVKRGYLTERSPIEERDVVKKMANIFHKANQKKRSWLFLVAYDCNFRCPYCFENEISDNGKGWSKRVFSEEMIDKAYDSMLLLEPDRRRHLDKITLYGGEPLLAKNKKVVESIVKKGQKRGYSFKAVTNGYEIDQFAHLMGKGGIESLQITIDGVKEKHNTRRTHYKDGGSFDKIISNIQIALDLGVKINIRINTDLNNFDDLSKIKDLFKSQGFYNYSYFSTHSALIHGESDMSCNVVMSDSEANRTTKSINEGVFTVPDSGFYDPEAQYINFEAEELRYKGEGESSVQLHSDIVNETDRIHTIQRGKYIDKYYKLVEADTEMHVMQCQDFGLRRKIEGVLKGKGLMSFSSVFCGAQTGMMIFDPYGDLYTCWELVGKDQYKVGSYKNGIEIIEDELEHWYGRNIGKTPACSQCKYAFFCGGGCMAGALGEGRGYDSPYCDGYPKTFQSTVPKVFEEFYEKQTKL